MPELVVLQHHPATGPSAFAPVLDQRAELPWRLVDVAAGDDLPAPDEVAGLVVLGGPMGVPDRAEYPWMDAELALLTAAVDAEVPVFGVCLGAQLLATALGGAVVRREVPEIGYLPLTRTQAGHTDAVAAGWPDGAAMLFSHEDEVATLPAGAVPLLAGSEGVSAWRCGSAHAVQFHPEVSSAQLAEWSTVLEALLARAGQDADTLLAEAERRERYHRSVGAALLSRWLDVEVLPRRREAG